MAVKKPHRIVTKWHRRCTNIVPTTIAVSLNKEIIFPSFCLGFRNEKKGDVLTGPNDRRTKGTSYIASCDRSWLLHGSPIDMRRSLGGTSTLKVTCCLLLYGFFFFFFFMADHKDFSQLRVLYVDLAAVSFVTLKGSSLSRLMARDKLQCDYETSSLVAFEFKACLWTRLLRKYCYVLCKIIEFISWEN